MGGATRGSTVGVAINRVWVTGLGELRRLEPERLTIAREGLRGEGTSCGEMISWGERRLLGLFVVRVVKFGEAK